LSGSRLRPSGVEQERVRFTPHFILRVSLQGLAPPGFAGIMKQTTLSDCQRSRTHLFMVRVWLEDLGEGKTEWRGKVQDVASGKARYFRDWQTLITYLQTMLANVKTEEFPQ
jgi:hypothetical protein